MYKRVLLAYDGSQSGQKALLDCREIVQWSQAELHLIAVMPTTVTPVVADGWSLATGLSLLVWFIYAPMCISTLATIKRETNSWKKMGFAAFYLFAAAYVAALITYQVTVALGGG